MAKARQYPSPMPEGLLTHGTSGTHWVPVPPGYEPLAEVLAMALEQAANGKGRKRHAADGETFLQQPIMALQSWFGSGFALGQAAKKTRESVRMGSSARERELLGAINYIAAAILHERGGPAGDDQREAEALLTSVNELAGQQQP